MAPTTQYFFLLDGTWIVHILNDGAQDGSHDMVSPFLDRVLNNFDVSRQLAEQREALLLRLLPRFLVRGGSEHEEKPVNMQQFIWCQIARSSTTVVPSLLFDFRKRRRAKRKVTYLP